MNTKRASGARELLTMLPLLCVLTVAGTARRATAAPVSEDICTSGFLSSNRMEKLRKIKVTDAWHNHRILPDEDDIENHVTKQGTANVCLFRKAVAELYVAAFSAKGTEQFMSRTDARRDRDSFHRFVPSCGTANEGHQDSRFEQIMARLQDAKLKIHSDEAILRKVVGEIGLLQIMCAERPDAGRSARRRHGEWKRQQGASDKGQGTARKDQSGVKKEGLGVRKERGARRSRAAAPL